MVNGQLEDITAKMVGNAAAAGDPLAIELIERAGFTIGLGIVSLLHIFNPQIIVVGGSVTKTGDLLFKPMRAGGRKICAGPGLLSEFPDCPGGAGG